MRGTLTEESILFASVIKWLLLASLTGVIVGLAATGFLALLAWGISFAGNYSFAFLLLPVAFFLSSSMTKYLAPDAEGHGTEKVIEAIHKRKSIIPIAVVPVKLIATVITLAIGGSAGKEGPCAQIGAGVSSLFSRFLKFDEIDRRKLVICGISAGFATVFGTPIAGAIFGVEVLFVGTLLYDVLLPSFIAGLTAYQISTFFGIHYLSVPASIIPPINETLLIKVVIAAMIFGVFSMLLVKTMQWGHRLSERLRVWTPAKGLIGGVVLILLALIFGKQYLGLGMMTITSCLNGGEVIWYAPLAKILFTSITLNFGGSGGIVTPIFFIGTTTGVLVAGLLQINPAMLAAIGFVSLLAGAANTPIAASIMALEMFGPSIGPYAAVACTVSFLITGHRSVYPSQILQIRKSSSITAEIGCEIEAIHPAFQQRHKTMSSFVQAVMKKLEGKEHKDYR